MRNGFGVVLITVAVLPLLRSAGVRTVTVAELRTLLENEHRAGHSDKRIAEEVGRIQLSERLTNTVFQELRQREAVRTQSALQLVADQSTFLDPAISEILKLDPPSPAEQQRLLSKASAYAKTYVHGLPDFQCRKLTRRFDDDAKRQVASSVAVLPGADTNAWKVQVSGTGNGRLSERDSIIEEVTFRNGHDVYDRVQTTYFQTTQLDLLPTLTGLRTSGEFGGLMASLFSAADRATFTWHHWESLDGKRLAVFFYRVGLTDSDFSIDWCCVKGQRIEQKVAYEGELSIAADGAIIRLWWEGENIPEQIPTRASETAVEYGPVPIGGVSYELPIRSVTITLTRAPFRPTAANLYIRSLNHVEFSGYHKFEAKSRLILH